MCGSRPQVNDVVELLEELSRLDLHPGDQGRVCGCHTSPVFMYEVEFGGMDEPERRLRVMVVPEHIHLVRSAEALGE